MCMHLIFRWSHHKGIVISVLLSKEIRIHSAHSAGARRCPSWNDTEIVLISKHLLVLRGFMDSEEGTSGRAAWEGMLTVDGGHII